jgi:lysozyme
MIKIPNERPKMTRDEVLKKYLPTWDWNKYPVMVLGVRGYYARTIGMPGNDFNVYDDAVFIITKDNFYAFNFNTDPAAWENGRAMLAPGQYFCYKLDLHQSRYLALCQRLGKVFVLRRSGATVTKSEGNFGINIHSGGENNTNSEGCQTVPPWQYPEFIYTLCKEYIQNGKNVVIPYVLVEETT